MEVYAIYRNTSEHRHMTQMYTTKEAARNGAKELAKKENEFLYEPYEIEEMENGNPNYIDGACYFLQYGDDKWANEYESFEVESLGVVEE